MAMIRKFRKTEKTCIRCLEVKKVELFDLPGTHDIQNHDKMCRQCNEDRLAGIKIKRKIKRKQGKNETGKDGLKKQFEITQKETGYTKEEIEGLLGDYTYTEIKNSYKDKNGRIIIKDLIKLDY